MKRSIKILLIVFAIVIIVIVTFNFLFGYIIKTQIERLTDHKLELKYKSSKTRLFLGIVEFKEAVVQFHDISIDSNSSIFIESISFEKFAITKLNLKDLLFNRSINIEKVLLRGPQIDFLKDTVIKQKDIFSKILTPDVISNKSQGASFSFEIGEVEIQQGSIQLSDVDKNDFSLGSINLKLSNISMDDLKMLNGNAPDFNANFNIRLGLYGINKVLPSNAEVIVDSVIYKKDKRLFEIGGLQLKRLPVSNEMAESEISLLTDLITVNGFSLKHFLSSKDVKFSQLKIANTEIMERGRYFKEKKMSDTLADTKTDQFSKLVNSILTDTLFIQNLNYRYENVETDSIDFINNLNIWLYDVKVDSNFISNKEYFKPLERSALLSGPIKMHMPEYGFDVSCDSMYHSGQRNVQEFVGLNLRTYPALFSEKQEYKGINFRTDSLVISGLEEQEWLDSTLVEFSVYLANPKFSGSNMSFKGSGKSGLPEMLPDKIILNKFKLTNGSINILGSSNEIIKTESLSVDVADLELYENPGKPGPKLKWQKLFTEVKNAQLKIPDKLLLELDNASINNNDFEFDGILYSENKTNSYNNKTDSSLLYVNQVRIDNFDLLAYINEKQLHIDKLLIDNPGFVQYTSDKPHIKTNPDSITPIMLYQRLNIKLPEVFSFIDVKAFQINDAEAVYKMERNNMVSRSSFSGIMQQLKFDGTQTLENVPEFTINFYEFCLSDFSAVSDAMSLSMEEVCYNSNVDRLTIYNSHAENVDKNTLFERQNGALFSITLPSIILEKPDFTPMSGGPISFHTIQLDNPDINIKVKATKEKSGNKMDESFRILPFTFLDENLVLNKGTVNINIKNEEDSTTISVGNIDLKVNDAYKIVGNVDHAGHNKNLFHYLDFSLSDIAVQGQGASTTIREIKYDKHEGLVSIQPIKQELFSKDSGTEFINSINIPQLYIQQPDLMLVNENVKSFGASNILLPNVDIRLESGKNEKTRKRGDIRLAVNDSTIRNFLGTVDFFHIDSTVVGNIGLTSRQFSDSDTSIFEIERISLFIDDLKVDTSHFDFHENPLAKDIVIQLHDKALVTADSLYDIKINDITYYYSRDKIVVDSFEVKPRYEKEAFFEKAGFQTDRMQIKFASAVVEGIDLLSIIESNKVQIDKCTVNTFKLMDHRDKHYTRKENDFKLMPKQSLQNLPFVLEIDTVEVNDSYLLYGEYVDESPKPGEVFFTNFNASFLNLTNISKPELLNNRILAQIDADIMNEAKMKLNFEIPMDKDASGFKVSGNVERTDLRHFNSMTENLFGISIVRGRGGVTIPLITANDTTSKGTLQFEYKRLKLAMYNRNKASLSRGLGSGLIDFMMNGVLVKSNNPTFFGKIRTGDVYAERNNERSFFNYVWKSTMSGLMTTMGFYNKDLRLEKRVRKGEEKIELKNERLLKKSN